MVESCHAQSPLEQNEKTGTNPEEVAYQKKYEKYLKEKERYEYYLKNKKRLDEFKISLASGELGFGSKRLYLQIKNRVKQERFSDDMITEDFGVVSLNNIETILEKHNKGYIKWYKDTLVIYQKKQFWKDTRLKGLYTKEDYTHGIVPHIPSWYVYVGYSAHGYGEGEWIGYYLIGTLTIPKKPIPPKKPKPKEVPQEVATREELSALKTQITPATFSQNDGKEFIIGAEVVDKKTYELYRQYKQDWMISADDPGGRMPKPGTPEKYQNLSWEYFKTTILHKDERYIVK